MQNSNRDDGEGENEGEGVEDESGGGVRVRVVRRAETVAFAAEVGRHGGGVGRTPDGLVKVRM